MVNVYEAVRAVIICKYQRSGGLLRCQFMRFGNTAPGRGMALVVAGEPLSLGETRCVLRRDEELLRTSHGPAPRDGSPEQWAFDHMPSGFREGALAGRDAAFQKGFDNGYAEGFKNGLLLGHVKGISRVLGSGEEENYELAHSELSKTSRGCCQLCATKSNSVSSETPTQSLSDIVQKQNNFIQAILKSIENKNADFVKEWNVLLPLSCINQEGK